MLKRLNKIKRLFEEGKELDVLKVVYSLFKDKIYFAVRDNKGILKEFLLLTKEGFDPSQKRAQLNIKKEVHDLVKNQDFTGLIELIFTIHKGMLKPLEGKDFELLKEGKLTKNVASRYINGAFKSAMKQEFWSAISSHPDRYFEIEDEVRVGYYTNNSYLQEDWIDLPEEEVSKFLNNEVYDIQGNIIYCKFKERPKVEVDGNTIKVGDEEHKIGE